MPKFELGAYKQDGWSKQIAFWLHDRSVPGQRLMLEAENLVVSKIPEMESRPPSFSLDETETQYLMDCLWKCGFRPSGGSGSAGSLAATQRHLDDMRSIVAKQLNVPLGTK